MAFDIFGTHTLLMGIEQVTPPRTFLRDRYFPTNEATDIFSTNDVLVEYKDGSKKLAPFVAPRKGGVTITRQGYKMNRFEPPFIAPRRTLTIDDLSKRGFGEAFLTTLTPEARQATMLMRDMQELTELIVRREEAMAAETLINNKCVLFEIADDMEKGDEKEIVFYEGGSNPATYTPATKWGEAGAKILDDIYTMAQTLMQRGLAATDLIVAPDVAAIIVNDEKIQKLLDIKNYDLGGVQPAELPNGVARIAHLNVYGVMIDVLSYAETYEDKDGKMKQYIPAGHVVLTAPNAGRTLYGAVSQVEQADGAVHTYTGRRIPKYFSDAQADVRTITLKSCPLLIPNNVNPWIAAKVTA